MTFLFKTGIYTFIFAGSFFVSGCIPPKQEPTEKPNVLFISIDDLNDWIEPMSGHPQALTPNLANFAGEAVVFQNAYCASPSCNPSRTAMLTGKYPYETGLYDILNTYSFSGFPLFLFPFLSVKILNHSGCYA